MLTVRYWAAARAAAGAAEEQATGGTALSALIAELSSRHGERFAAVLERCSFLIDGEQLRRGTDRMLPADGIVDILPPFAGGCADSSVVAAADLVHRVGQQRAEDGHPVPYPTR